MDKRDREANSYLSGVEKNGEEQAKWRDKRDLGEKNSYATRKTGMGVEGPLLRDGRHRINTARQDSRKSRFYLGIQNILIGV